MNAYASDAAIVELETLRPPFQPNVTLLLLRSADSQVGLGEAFFAAGAVEAYLHEQIAPVLLGLPDPTPERVSALLTPYVGFQGGGVVRLCRAGGPHGSTRATGASNTRISMICAPFSSSLRRWHASLPARG